uniref:Uncharacterized protein n=1 Tax=uncultured prokaryote TaxID=198431 RepID=A0A0H5Q3S7_9ZZZZ|nr:hypothetical protein [uncultured prokaryote]
MVYAPHVLINFGGSLGGTPTSSAEEWSCNIRVATYDTTIPRDRRDASVGACEEYLRDTVSEALPAWFSNPLANIGNYAWLEYMKVNAIAPNGRYLYDETVVDYISPVQGGVNVTASNKPFQTAKVLTMETGETRGKASRGRIYLPQPANALQANGTFQLLAFEMNAHAAMVNDLSATLISDLEEYVFEPSVISPLGGPQGTVRAITGVSMDDVFDTQRRRARSISGTRLTQNFDL